MPGAGDPVAGRLRAGGRALLLLADPASVSILRQLSAGPLDSTELFERVDFVSRSTYFERIRDLEELTLVARKRREEVPPAAECRLTTPGERLLPVARRLEAWLADAPQGPLKLGEAYATATVKALAVAWGSTLLRWLAERPRSLAELEQLIEIFGYRKLERIARDLVKAGLVERVAASARPSRYGLTDWARRAAGLLTAAMRWERHEIAERSASVTSVEAEGVLLLGLPLIELPSEANGSCALLVEADSFRADGIGGVVVRMVDGRPVSWAPVGESGLGAGELEADGWVSGPTLAWLGTGTNSPDAILRVGGNSDLAEQALAALREFGSVRPSLSVGVNVESPDLS
jgi:DNA-binding HxlR family transcriptional regulator